MINLAINITRSYQYIDRSEPTYTVYDAKKNEFKDGIVNDWMDLKNKNLKVFSESVGVDIKKLTSWIYNG